MTTTGDPSVPPPPAEPPKAPPRRRRWKRILLIGGGTLLGLLLLAAILVPPVAGAVIRSRVPAAIGEALDADVTLGDASFRWSGRILLEDLKVVPRGFSEPLLRVPRVRADVALFSALGGSYLADVEIEAPRVVVERDAAGRFNYDAPPRPRKPSEPEGSGDPKERPIVRATLRVRGGEVLIRGAGAETRFHALAMDAKVDGLDRPVSWSLSLADPSGGRVEGAGEVEAGRAGGRARFDVRGLALANLSAAARAWGDPTLALAGTLDASGEYAHPGVSGRSRATLKALELRHRGRAYALETVTLSHEGDQGLSRLRVEAGRVLELALDGDLRRSTLELGLNLREAAAFLKASGLVKADLAAEGRVVMKGTAGLSPLSWDLRASSEGAAVTLDGRPLKVDGVAHESRGTIDDAGDGGATFSVSSGKAVQVRIAATLASLYTEPAVEATLDASSDLAELGPVLEKALGFKPGIEGISTLKARLVTKGGDARVELEARTSGLARNKVPLEKELLLELRGAWRGTSKTASAERLKLTSSVATIEGRGGLSADGRLLPTVLSLDADLAALGAKLGALLEKPPALAGKASLRARAEGSSIAADGTLTGLKVDGYGPVDATLKHEGTLERGTLRLASAALDATLSGTRKDLSLEAALRPAELSKWIPGLDLGGEPITVAAVVEGPAVRGSVEAKSLAWKGRTLRLRPLRFDVRRQGDVVTARLRSELVEWIEAAYAGKAGLEAELTYSPKGASGTTTLVNLEAAGVKEPALTLTHDVAIADGVYDLRRLEIQSGSLRGGLTGRVTKAPRFENVRGSFRFHPDRLGALLKPFMPGTLAGAEEKTLTIALDGTSLRDAKGTLELDIPRYTHTGVTLEGRASFSLDGGLLRTSSPLNVNRGRTELNAALDLREAPAKPRSEVELRAKDVDANADMAPFLSSINPIFHTVNGTVAGKSTADFRLAWAGPLDPATEDWEKAAGPALSGSGRLAVKDLVVTGSPAVGEIMRALGEGNELRGELLGTDIQVRNGRCEYKDMTLRLARYELRFSGWVGFDKRMELMVEMPLTPGIRKRYPNLEKYTGRTLFVPLRGSASSPRLDFERAIEELIKRAVPNLVEDALRKILERREKKDK